MAHIDSYSFGSMVVDGTVYSSDLMIFPDRIIPDWRRKNGHSLCAADIPEVFCGGLETVIVGKGSDGCMEVPAEIAKIFAARHIKLIAKNTAEASELFNDYAAKGRKVAGLFHLTC